MLLVIFTEDIFCFVFSIGAFLGGAYMPRGRPKRLQQPELDISKSIVPSKTPIGDGPSSAGVKSTTFVSAKFMERLSDLDNSFKRKRSMGKNIIDDSRIKPSNRFYKFVAEAVKNGYDPNVAAEYAIRRMESRRENIAGNWGKMDWSNIK